MALGSETQRPGARRAGVVPDAHSATQDERSYAVGIVTHQSYDELERCLASVARQSAPPLYTVVVDGAPEPERLDGVRARHPDVALCAGPNRGYAGGANAVLAAVEREAPAARFVLILNPDIELAPDFCETLIAAVLPRTDVALAGGKLLRPEGSIDSAGIVMPRNRRPRDRGSEEPDTGQYDRSELVFGVSGAALLLRRASLPALELDGEIFDESFFMYHEDTDLAWRAARLGWRALYVPDARAVHQRGWRREQRFRQPVAVRRHSFKNHYLEIIKNERARDFWINLPVTLLWEGLRLGFALLHDRAVLPAYVDAWRLSGSAWRKRRLLQRRVRSSRRARPESRP